LLAGCSFAASEFTLLKSCTLCSNSGAASRELRKSVRDLTKELLLVAAVLPLALYKQGCRPRWRLRLSIFSACHDEHNEYKTVLEDLKFTRLKDLNGAKRVQFSTSIEL
jgi:hypothetical protein